MLHVDPWSKVAECERAIAIIADPERRIVLHSLRDFWIALGNEVPHGSARDESDPRSTIPLMHTQLSTVNEIHTQLMAGCRDAMH